MVKMSWNPAAYLEFAAYRARPAEDLIARLDVKVPGGIVDLGCGPGNLTAKLKQRWPSRAVTGFDASPEMLAKARASVAADITWEQGDIAAWLPGAQAALVFANAALHWVPDHAGLFPRLMHALAPGGLLAVQMSMTGEALYHQCLQRVLDAPRWRPPSITTCSRRWRRRWISGRPTITTSWRARLRSPPGSRARRYCPIRKC